MDILLLKLVPTHLDLDHGARFHRKIKMSIFHVVLYTSCSDGNFSTSLFLDFPCACGCVTVYFTVPRRDQTDYVCKRRAQLRMCRHHIKTIIFYSSPILFHLKMKGARGCCKWLTLKCFFFSSFNLTVHLSYCLSSDFPLSYTAPPVCTPLRSRWPETSQT